MYTVRITHHPAPGKAAELRAALEEHSKAANVAGSPHNVTQLLYAAEPTLVNNIRHESLAALENYGARNASDPVYQARTAKITACLARPQHAELFQTLVSTPITGDVNYLLRITYYPAQAMDIAIRQTLFMRANTPSSGSVGKRLSSQVVPPDGANYNLTILFSNLAGFEQYLGARAGDAGVQALAALLPTLVVRPNHQELHRVWLPFPPS